MNGSFTRVYIQNTKNWLRIISHSCRGSYIFYETFVIYTPYVYTTQVKCHERWASQFIFHITGNILFIKCVCGVFLWITCRHSNYRYIHYDCKSWCLSDVMIKNTHSWFELTCSSSCHINDIVIISSSEVVLRQGGQLQKLLMMYRCNFKPTETHRIPQALSTDPVIQSNAIKGQIFTLLTMTGVGLSYWFSRGCTANRFVLSTILDPFYWPDAVHHCRSSNSSLSGLFSLFRNQVKNVEIIDIRINSTDLRPVKCEVVEKGTAVRRRARRFSKCS